MQTTVSIDGLLGQVASLPLEEQEFLVETISRRLHEARRLEIANRAREAQTNYEAGIVRTGSVEDLLSELNHD